MLREPPCNLCVPLCLIPNPTKHQKCRVGNPIRYPNLPESVLVVFRDLNISGYQSTTSFTSGMISPLAFPDISIDIQQLLT
jgi:hypothetical protein